MRRLAAVSLLALVVVAAFAAGGHALGERDAVTQQEAVESRREARLAAADKAERDAFAASRARGRRAGFKEGRSAGQRRGNTRGQAAGSARADERAAELAAAQAQAAAEAEAAERARNCGAPLFVPGYCPTDEEIAAENQAESLCGPGHYEEARAQGISCFPPGDSRNP